MRSEYADAVWNAYAPEWFAGVRSDGGRDILTGVGATQLSVLYSIHASLSSRWGASGLGDAVWNDYLLSTYYGGRSTSLAFDQGISLFDAEIDSNAAAGIAYTGIDHSFLKSTSFSPALLLRYYHVAGAKGAIDAAIDAQGYDELSAENAVSAYLAAHPDADSPQVSSFINAYLDLFRGSTGPVYVYARKDSWLPLLQSQLGGNTLSALSSTSSFKVVAAVDLLRAVSGALTDNGLTGCDSGC